MTSSHNNCSKRGFTLVELLVVIAIIAILAAILFPVFAQAKIAAKKTVSLNNVKELGLSHLMYSGDYDDMFTTSWAKGFPGDFNYFVQPYMKNYQILTNPLRAINPSSIASVCANDPWGSWYFGPPPNNRDNPLNLPLIWSYGFNNGYQYNNDTGLVRVATTQSANANQTITVVINGVSVTTTIRAYPEVGISQTSVVAPANTFMLGSTNGLPLMAIDIDDLRPQGFTLYGTTDTPCEAAVRVSGGVDAGGYCMTYVDGHAKWQHFNQGKSGIQAQTSSGYDPLAVPDACQYDSSYDGSSDTVHLCKEGYPNG